MEKKDKVNISLKYEERKKKMASIIIDSCLVVKDEPLEDFRELKYKGRCNESIRVLM